MRKIEFVQSSCAGPFSEDRQARFEEYHGVQLDSEFVSLCKQCNGGVSVLRCFDVAGRERMIDRFLCLLENIYVSSAAAHADYDIEVTWTQIEDRLRPGLIPIAVLFAGDMLCLRYKAEYDWEGDPTTMLTMTIILSAISQHQPCVSGITSSLASSVPS